jgi:glycolate oxidase iron-sulfur subunit
MSNRILAEKMEDVLSTKAEVIVTANPGCQMQLAAGLAARGSLMRVEHVSELLLRGYGQVLIRS